MKVGDLVRYGNDRDYGIGIVVAVMNYHKRHSNEAMQSCTVLWNNGVESTHGGHWLIKIKENT